MLGAAQRSKLKNVRLQARTYDQSLFNHYPESAPVTIPYHYRRHNRLGTTKHALKTLQLTDYSGTYSHIMKVSVLGKPG